MAHSFYTGTAYFIVPLDPFRVSRLAQWPGSYLFGGALGASPPPNFPYTVSGSSTYVSTPPTWPTVGNAIDSQMYNSWGSPDLFTNGHCFGVTDWNLGWGGIIGANPAVGSVEYTRRRAQKLGNVATYCVVSATSWFGDKSGAADLQPVAYHLKTATVLADFNSHASILDFDDAVAYIDTLV